MYNKNVVCCILPLQNTFSLHVTGDNTGSDFIFALFHINDISYASCYQYTISETSTNKHRKKRLNLSGRAINRLSGWVSHCARGRDGLSE
jgi:hypothetical protein